MNDTKTYNPPSGPGACSPVVCIGGLADGERYKSVNDLQVFRLAVPNGDHLLEQRYRKEYIVCGNRRWVVGVAEGMTMEQAMDRLVDGYTANVALCGGAVATYAAGHGSHH